MIDVAQVVQIVANVGVLASLVFLAEFFEARVWRRK
jgi:hypothetical protein